MAPSFLWLACLLVPQRLVQAKTCALEDDAQVLLQTSADLRPRGALIDARQGLDGVASKKPLFTRPNVGKGPDHVEFGMRVKKFYGVDLPANTFELDLVLTLKWKDPRTAALIPAGAPNITLSEVDATMEMWLPEITVTNRNIHKKDIISTAVMLHKTGEVVKVQRLIVIIKQEFLLKEYPFDTQDLAVDIASSQYMSPELLLVPSSEPSMSGVNKNLFTRSYSLEKWSITEEKTDSGLLEKSRGLLHMEVQRGFEYYLQSHLVPSACVMLLSCGVFFFPFTGPFVTPRIGLTILSYLAFTKMAQASNKAIPSVHPTTWNDILNQNVELVMVIGAILNVYTEYRHHQTKVDAVAKRINNECKIIMPAMIVVVVTAIMLFGALHWTMIGLDITVKVLLLLSIILYSVYNEMRTKVALQAKKAKEAAA